jgi:hypothetical protein
MRLGDWRSLLKVEGASLGRVKGSYICCMLLLLHDGNGIVELLAR